MHRPDVSLIDGDIDALQPPRGDYRGARSQFRKRRELQSSNPERPAIDLRSQLIALELQLLADNIRGRFPEIPFNDFNQFLGS